MFLLEAALAGSNSPNIKSLACLGNLHKLYHYFNANKTAGVLRQCVGHAVLYLLMNTEGGLVLGTKT